MDESGGQILTAIKDPAAPGAAGQDSAFAGSIGSNQAACFRDPAFVQALPRAAAPIGSAFVDAALLAGLVGAGFIGLGALFSLLLPGRAPTPADKRAEDRAAETDDATAGEGL